MINCRLIAGPQIYNYSHEGTAAGGWGEYLGRLQNSTVLDLPAF